VVGFSGAEATALALEHFQILDSGCPVRRAPQAALLPVGSEIIGRIINSLGEPLDGAPLPPPSWPLRRRAPEPLSRRPVDQPLVLGLRCIDGLLTLGRGQRVALEAGPGAGKSSLLAYIAAQADAEVVIIALIGERGREVGEFLKRLSPQARARSILVVARADDPPMAWIRAAETATALAEYFRGEGRDVILLVDSLTRVARAIRTVGIAAGEPTTRRGFPPSLSTRLSELLERSSNDEQGTLTALYAVLVEGDQQDDPVAEEARALLDGHLVLEAKLAAAGRFPALDPLRSISRCMSAVSTPAQRRAVRQLRAWLAALTHYEDLLRVGAYKPGSDPLLDKALKRRSAIEAFLRQGLEEHSRFDETLRCLEALAR